MQDWYITGDSGMEAVENRQHLFIHCR